MPGKGSFLFRRSKSERKDKPRPVVVDQREIENLRKFVDSKRDNVTSAKPVSKSVPTSLHKTEEELVEHPAGKYKRPIMRKSTKPAEQTRKSADDINKIEKQDKKPPPAKHARPVSLQVRPGTPVDNPLVTFRKKSGDRTRRPVAIQEGEVLEWPPDYWNRSPGRVRPDDFITRPISLDISLDDEELGHSSRIESTASTPQPQPKSPLHLPPRPHSTANTPQESRPPLVLHKPPPAPTPPTPPPVSSTQQEPNTAQQNRPSEESMKQKQKQQPAAAVGVFRSRSDVPLRALPRTAPYSGPAPKNRRYTEVPREALLMSQSFDLGEIDHHHRRRALSVGNQKKQRPANTPDFNERQRVESKYNQEMQKRQRDNILRTKTTDAAGDRHAQSVMDVRDWELYWDQYQSKKNGKHPSTISALCLTKHRTKQF